MAEDKLNPPNKEETQSTALVPRMLTAMSFLVLPGSKTPHKDDDSAAEENMGDKKSTPSEKKTAPIFLYSQAELSLFQILPSLFSVIKQKILATAQENLDDIRAWISVHQAKDLPFAWKNKLDEDPKIIIDPQINDYDIWYIGDLHGDILACDVILRYIFEKSPSARVVFLGDLIDRQEYSMEVFAKVVTYILKYPGQILWIAGNHDIGIRYDDDNQKFISTVEPAEFSSWLNAHQEFTDLGKFFIEVAEHLPRALFLGDGLCVVHGGLPGKEQLASIAAFEDLGSPIALDAYTSNRLNPDKPRARGKELGWENVHAFLEKASSLLEFSVTRVLRGHDHCEKDRYLFFEQYKENPVLTFVSLSAWTEDEAYFKNLYQSIATSLIVAHHRKGLLPEIVELKIPESLVTEFWGASKATCEKDEKG